MKPCIALDKSYLTACSKEKFTEVCNTYRILAPESLIYELLKEPTEVRASLFSKFPETVRPYQVVSNVGTLLRHEITSHTAYGLPSVRNLVRDYSIHRLLVDRSYTLDARQQRLLEAKRAEIELDAEVFLSMLDPLRKYYQKALSGSDDSRQRNRDALERQIGDIVIADESIHAFREDINIHDAIPALRAAKILECDASICTGLLALGKLEGIYHGRCLYVTTESLASFQKRYISCVSIAKRLGTSSRRVTRILLAEGVDLLRVQRTYRSNITPQVFCSTQDAERVLGRSIAPLLHQEEFAPLENS